MRRAVAALGVLIGAVMPGAAPAPVAQTPPVAVSDYQFAAATGVLVFHVHRDRTADFEAVMRRVDEGLRATATPQRREQATGWRLFRARDTVEAAIYVVLIDPVVQDADYDPVKMLTELAPTDAPMLYERLRAAVIRVERLDLEPVP